MKENDIILNMLANPKFTLEDFQAVGLNSDNTGLQSEDKYLQSDKIKSVSAFQDSNGQFDKNKFHNFYQSAGQFYNQMSNDDYEKAILEQAQYSKDNIWINPKKRTVDYKPTLVKRANPTLVTNSLEQMGQMGKRTLSTSEIAQTQAVVNPITGEKSASPNDSFFSNLFNTLVLASYDNDVVDPKTGEVLHKKGDLKYNEDGLPYYETLSGRDVHDKQVLNKMNTLTTDGSVWNKFDFFDSDDLDQKGIGSSLLKNAALVGSMFIPYVGPVITGLSVATQTAGVLATLGKLVTGNDNPTLNNIQGWAKSINRQSATEYAQQHTWCAENFINMIGDTIGQLAEQRWIFKAAPVLFEGKDAWKVMSKEGYDALKKSKLAELQKTSSLTTDKLLQDAVSEKNVPLLQQYMTELNAINETKAAKYVDDLVRKANNIGSPLSKAYMIGITVQDTYGNAKAAGASDLEAALLTLGYAGGEAWILNTGLGEWILPELHIDKFKNKAIAEALVKPVNDAKERLGQTGDKQGFVKELLKIGRNVATNVYAEKAMAKKSAEVIGAHALGEAFEETSEELLADASKAILNITRWLRGKDALNFWDGDNALDRYTMSALGGLLGGGITSAATNFSQVRSLAGMDNSAAMQQLLYMANNNQLGDFLKQVDKMTLGDKNKSATKTIYDSEQGVIFAEGTKDDNQDLAAKQAIRNQVKFIDNILTTNGAKISTDSLLSKLAMEDQQDVLRNLKIGNLKNTNVIGTYAQDYLNLQADLITASAQLKAIDDEIGDVKSAATPEQQKARTDKAAEIDGIRGRLQEYLNGTISPDFIRDAVFEINPLINDGFVITSLEQYTKAKVGKLPNQLSDTELAKLTEEFKNYMNSDGKQYTHTAAAAYQNMMELGSPIVQQYQELIKQANTNNNAQFIQDFNQFITNYLIKLDSIDTSDQEAYQTRAQLLNNSLAYGVLRQMAQPYLSEDQRNRLQSIADSTETDPNVIAQLNQEANNILIETISTNVDNLVKPVLQQGFIHPEARKALSQGLSKLKDLIVTKADNDFMGVYPGHPDYEEAKKRRKESVENIHQIDDLQEQIEKLPTTPALEFIDKFKIGATNSQLKFSDHWQQTMDLLDNNKDDMSEFGTDEVWEANNQEALRLAKAFRSVLNGVKVDNADINNPTGYSRMLNLVYQKSAQKNYVPLAEISTQEANMMLEDVSKIIARLEFADTLTKMNRGQKLKEQNKVAARKNQLLYNDTKRLIDTLSDSDWKDTSIADLKNTFNNITTEVKDALEGEGVKQSKETRAAVEKYMMQLDNAIYDFFQANKDSKGELSVEKIGKLLKKFAGNAGFFQKTNNILNESTKSLSDNSYIWYLASRAAVKASDFYGSYKKAVNDKVAPIASQELATYLGVAAIANMNTLNKFVDAYRNTVVQEFNNLSEKERTDLLNQFDNSGEAYSKDLLKYFGAHDVLPQYKNMIFIEGIAGSGKSKAVFRNVINTINHINPEYLKNAYYVHETSDSAQKAAEDLELQGQTFGRVDFLKHLSSEWKNIRDNSKDRKNYLYKDSYKFDPFTGKLENTWKLNKIADAPKVIFIDEISHYNQQEVSMIEQWAKEHGTIVLTAGDFDQDTSIAFIDDVKYKGNPVSVTLNRNNFIRSPKLGVSLRTLNKQLTNCTKMMQLAIQNLNDGKDVDLNFTYLDNDPEHLGLFGVKIAKPVNVLKGLSKEELDRIVPTIDLMVSTSGDEKIGYIYHDTNTELYKLLTTKYKDKIIPYKDSDAQGLEGKYYIVENDIHSNVPDSVYLRSLYTGITRASQGVLAITPTTTKGIKTIGTSQDKRFQLETIGAKAIKHASKERLEQLEDMVDDNNAITKLEAPTNTPTPTKPQVLGGLLPILAPASVPPANTATSQADANIEVENFKKLIYNLDGTTNSIAKKLDQKFDIISVEAKEDNGNWIPTVKLKNGDDEFGVPLVDFNKEYTLQKKDDKTTVPLYTVGQTFLLQTGPTDTQITIDEVLSGEPLTYKVHDKEGKSFEITQESIQKLYKGEVPTEPITPQITTITTGMENTSEEEYESAISQSNIEDTVETPKSVGTLYTMNTYLPGMKNDNGKAVFDDDSPESQARHDARIDGFVGLSRILKTDDWKELDDYFAYCRNALFTSERNADAAKYLANILGLTGNVNIRYALKSSAGRINSPDPRYYRYDQGENEKCEYLHSDSKDANDAMRKKVVAILFNDGKPVLEIPVASLNSPISLIYYTDEEGNLLHPDLNKAYTDALIKYQGNKNQSDLAVQEVINQFDKSGTDQDIVDLFKVYRFTGNGIFFFDESFNLAEQSPTGIILTGEKGKLQQNGSYQTSNKFIDVSELAKNPQFRVSKILTSRNGLVNGTHAVNPGHSFILVGNPKEFAGTTDLVNQYERQIADPKAPKKVSLYYVMPPKTTVSAWLTNQHNLYLNTLGQNKQVYNIGNDFTGYRVLDCLDKQGLLDFIPSIGSTAQGYKSGQDVLDSIKTILSNVRAIESKWKGDLALDNSNQIEGRGEEEYYQMLINQGMKEPDARRVMSIKEVNQYLRQPSSLLFQEGRTNNQVLNAYLTCMVWNRTKAIGQKEVITYHPEVLDWIQQACENAEEPLKDIFYKTQYTDKAHGSFLEIQQRANWQLEGINGDAAFRINARIDTTNFTSDELPIARIAGEIEQKAIRTKDGREVKVWSMTPDAKQKYEAVYLDQKKLENKPDPIDEYAPYMQKIGISEKELANIIALNHGDKSAIQRDIARWFNSQDVHNFGFTYNGNIYLFNNSEYSLISRPTSLATTDNLVLKGVDNNGEHDITITFNVDGNGNITSMQGNVTTFKQVSAGRQIPDYMESMEEQLKDKRSSWEYYRNDIQREDHGITYITGIPYQSTIEPSINLAVDSGVLPKKYAKYLNKDRPGSIALEDLQEIIDIFKKKGINSPTNLLSYIKNDGITVSKEEWEEAQNGIRDSIPPLLARNSVFLREYDKSISAQGKRDLKRSLGTVKKFLSTAKKKGDKVKEEAWEKVISIVESITSSSTPTISLENEDTVIQNGKRYTIIDKENLIGEDEVTKEQVTLTTDNLIKEETQCIPVKFNMI